MVAIRWNAPVYTHSYAQFLQINASIDEINGGSWVLPVIAPAANEPAHKPQLYAWILSTAMLATNAADLPPAVMELVFRTPTILAGAGLLLLTYGLGRRWYGRGPALAAGVLMATMLHMQKLVFLATTDMLLTFWIVWCIWAADRLTFHPAAGRRWPWAVALWAGMILAAITKGWGIVNIALVGGWLVFAGCLGCGFAALRRAESPGATIGLAVRLLTRRAWAIMQRVKLGWGLLAMVAVSVPLWWAMLEVGGEHFRQTVYFELVQRITGEGEHAPGAMRGPAVAHLYYNTLPASIFAGCALFLAPLLRRSRRQGWGGLLDVIASWLGRRSPIALPMWWIVTVVLAFAIPAGFRADYLFPCYPAVALLAGWAARELMRSDRYAAGVGKHLRRICQAAPLVIGAAAFAAAALYLALGGRVDWLPLPDVIVAGTWTLLAVVLVVALAAFTLGIAGIRRGRLGLSIAGCALGMLAVTFCYSHLWSKQARTGDGEVLVGFASRIKPVIGDQPFANITTLKTGVDAYMGRFGWDPRPASGGAIAALNASDVRYAVVCDRTLIGLGFYRPDGAARTYRIKLDGTKTFFDTAPEALGRVVIRSAEPFEMEDWGHLYLVELQRPLAAPAEPVDVGYVSDVSGEF
jgi:4-amino-4-deoxy-L-arabinose transferase-like glycosyltransferase